MPLPQRTIEETEDQFVQRCMADPTMTNEFWDRRQRMAVCRSRAKPVTNQFSDYPQEAVDNAKRAVDIREEKGIDCGTQVGWERASQLINGEALSEDTVNRMVSFFARHEDNKDGDPKEDCGALMWLAWGGDAAKRWAEQKTNDNE